MTGSGKGRDRMKILIATVTKRIVNYVLPRVQFQEVNSLQRFCKCFLFLVDMSVCLERVCMPINQLGH